MTDVDFIVIDLRHTTSREVTKLLEIKPFFLKIGLFPSSSYLIMTHCANYGDDDKG